MIMMSNDVLKKSIIQGDQLNMAVFFWYLEKVTCPVYTCTVAYTGQVNLYKVTEKHGPVKLVTLYLLN